MRLRQSTGIRPIYVHEPKSIDRIQVLECDLFAVRRPSGIETCECRPADLAGARPVGFGDIDVRERERLIGGRRGKSQMASAAAARAARVSAASRERPLTASAGRSGR